MNMSRRLGSFLDAMADGQIDASELKAQEERVVALMKTVEPELSDELHEQVTHLLCELSAYNIMHTIHHLMEASPRPSSGGKSRGFEPERCAAPPGAGAPVAARSAGLGIRQTEGLQSREEIPPSNPCRTAVLASAGRRFASAGTSFSAHAG